MLFDVKVTFFHNSGSSITSLTIKWQSHMLIFELQTSIMRSIKQSSDQMSSQILYMKHSFLKHGFVLKWFLAPLVPVNCIITILCYGITSIFQWIQGPVGITEVCSGDLWFLGSTSALRGPLPPTLQSSLPSQAQLLHPETPPPSLCQTLGQGP